MKPWWTRWRALFQLERKSFLAGGRDVIVTTRRSFLSLEARAGALFFLALFLLSPLQTPAPAPYPFDPGPAFRRLAADALVDRALFQGLLLLLHLTVGAFMGILLGNGWDLAESFLPWPSRLQWPRRLRWSATAGALAFIHVGALLSGRGGWLGRPWTGLAAAVALAGLAQMARRFYRWFVTFPLPARVATGVLGAGTCFFFLGLWGVFRFHRPTNEGPNLVVLAVEGLRASDLKDAARAPALAAGAHRGRVFASCVPTVPQREASLMTLLTGRSPFSHGVRHAFPTESDVQLGADSLPAQFRRAGYETAVVAGAGGDLLGRVAPFFDQVRAPDLSAPGLLRRDALRRAVHLLPYLRGRTVGRWLPALRAVPGIMGPDFLAGEAAGLLKQLRFGQRFFLLVHVPAGAPVEEVDRAAGKIAAALDELGLEDSTWVAWWSPFVDGGDVSSPSRFSAPLVLMGQRRAPRWVQAPVRDVDVAPTLLSAIGLSIPDSMDGLPLLELSPEAPDFGQRDIVTETDLWTDPKDNPLPEPLRLSYGPPSEWLEEDPESEGRGEGRLRIRPTVEDAVLSYRHRLLQVGKERLIYRPGLGGVVFEYYDLSQDKNAKTNLAGTRFGAERVRDLKEILFQELRREAGWRPQNDFWIPEAIMREKK